MVEEVVVVDGDVVVGVEAVVLVPAVPVLAFAEHPARQSIAKAEEISTPTRLRRPRVDSCLGEPSAETPTLSAGRNTCKPWCMGSPLKGRTPCHGLGIDAKEAYFRIVSLSGQGPRRVSSDKADQARSSTRHLNCPGFTYALSATRTSAPSWAIPRRPLSTPERSPDVDALATADGMGGDETSLG